MITLKCRSVLKVWYSVKRQVRSQSMIFCKKAGQFSKYDIAYRFMNHRGVIVVVFRMVVGFTATFAISVFHHWSCEFEFHSGEVYLIELYVIKFQWLATGWWFSPGTPVSSTNKTDCHNIIEMLLKVALNTIKQTNGALRWSPSLLFLMGDWVVYLALLILPLNFQ